MTEEAIFAGAIAISDPTARAAFLERACKGNESLRREVECLLAAHAVSNPLDRPAVVAPEQTQSFVPSREQAGTVIVGRYKLLEEIGAGGMGTVWVAEQLEPVKRKVALKLIKPGMDSRAVLARFEAERQALALMDHPNIAKVHDGGLTESGRPYFVMEYVKGIPITEYCDATRLNIAERLQLFIQVCHAVQHAHQKGVIHRDLKPSNILVAPYDGKPVPKVIDFGLAKAMHQSLTDKTLHTAHDSVLGTPLYMSPEQAQLNNLDVDTRSDVYSLGVLLYELLTGTTPLDRQRFKEAAWDEIRRLIREEEPQRPSARLSSTASLPSLAASRQTEPLRLTKLLRGELDWIVMKTLEKERERRYDSANSLGCDIQRYLADEPVLAGPPSIRYRLRKFMRRNKGTVAAAGLFVVTLIVGIIGTSIGLVLAENARRDAQDNEAKAKDAAVKEAAARADADEKRQHADALASNMAKLAASEKIARGLAEARERESRWHLYKARMFPLREAWLMKNYGSLEQLLKENTPKAGEPDFRGWEWRYFEDQVRQNNPQLGSSTSYHGPGDWSLKSRRIAAVTTSNTIEIWNPDTGVCERTLPKPANYRQSLEIMLRSVRFSPDGSRLAGINDHSAYVWDVAVGKLVHVIEPRPEPRLFGLAWSPDGTRLALGGSRDQDVIVVRLDAPDKLERIASAPINKDVPSGIFALDWHPDGERLAVSSRFGWTRILNLNTKEILTSKYNSSDGTPGMSIRWSPSGKRLAAIQWPQIIIYSDTMNIVLQLRPTGEDYRVNSLQWPNSNAAEFLLAGCSDHSVRGIYLTTAKREPLRARLRAGPVSTIAAGADTAEFMSISTASGLRVNKFSDPKKAMTRGHRLDHPSIKLIVDLSWSPNGRWLAASTQREIALFDPQTAQYVRNVNLVPGTEHTNSQQITWNHATGELVGISYGAPSRAIFWDPETGEITREWTLNMAGANASVDITRDGQWLATGNFQTASVPLLWNVADKKPMPAINQGPGATEVAFRPDGKELATRTYGGLFVCHVSTLKRRRLDLGSGNGPLAWDASGSHIAIGMADGGFVVYRASDGKKLHVARGHTGAVHRLRWSPDGHRIATASADGTVIIWDSATCDALLTIPFEGGNYGLKGLSWSPDGRRLACGFADGKLFILGSTTFEPTPKNIEHLPARIAAKLLDGSERSGPAPSGWPGTVCLEPRRRR